MATKSIVDMNPHISRADAVADPQLWPVKYRTHPKDRRKPFVFEREVVVNRLGMTKTVPQLYLNDIYRSLKNLKDLYLAIMKCRQSRLSEFGVNAAEYIVDTLQGVSVLYILQDDKAGKKFCRKRIDTSISFSPYLSSVVEFIEAGFKDKRTDSLEMKKFRDNWLYVLYSTAKGGSRSPDADVCLFDEYDKHSYKSTDDGEESYLSTMDDSEYQARLYLSTPTFPDYGIDLRYKASSMGIWTINCRTCLQDFVMDSNYFFNGGIVKLPNRRFKDGALHIYVCPHCGNEVNVMDKQVRGRYVHRKPELVEQNRLGFSFSTLILPHVSADKAKSQYEDFIVKPGGRRKYVNEKLGEACTDDETMQRLTRELMLSCVNKDRGWVNEAYGTIIGVDWGKDTHAVVWKFTNNQCKLLNIFEFPGDSDPLSGAKNVVKLLPRYKPLVLTCDFGDGRESNKYVYPRAKDIFYAAIHKPGQKDMEPEWVKKTRSVYYELISTYQTYCNWFSAMMIELPALDMKLEKFIQHHENSLLIDQSKLSEPEKIVGSIERVQDSKPMELGHRGPIHFLTAALYGWLYCIGKGASDFSFSELPKDEKLREELTKFTFDDFSLDAVFGGR